jgi:hypothetical protein
MRKRQRRHNSQMALDSTDFKGILQSLFQKDGNETEALSAATGNQGSTPAAGEGSGGAADCGAEAAVSPF